VTSPLQPRRGDRPAEGIQVGKSVVGAGFKPAPTGFRVDDRYDDLLARDKVNLDICWLRDESLEDTANLPEPDVIAAEIVDDLGSALEQFRAIAEDLGE
jgi:hypothetical protein